MNPRVIDCVVSHLTGRFNGNSRQIKQKYNLLGEYSVKKFINECKSYAAELGLVFIYDEKLNHFVCMGASLEKAEALVRKTLKNHYSQGKSTRKSMATLYAEGRISEIYDNFIDTQRDQKAIIDSLSE